MSESSRDFCGDAVLMMRRRFHGHAATGHVSRQKPPLKHDTAKPKKIPFVRKSWRGVTGEALVYVFIHRPCVRSGKDFQSVSLEFVSPLM